MSFHFTDMDNQQSTMQTVYKLLKQEEQENPPALGTRAEFLPSNLWLYIAKPDINTFEELSQELEKLDAILQYMGTPRKNN